MKDRFKLILPAVFLLHSASLYALNTDLMVGVGAKSKAMGGVGIAKGFGADSGFSNPALIHESKGFGAESSFANPHLANEHIEFTINATKLNHEVGIKPYFNGSQTIENFSNDIDIIPELGFVYIVNDFALGINVMGAEYSNTCSVVENINLSKTQIETQVVKIAIPLSYKIGANFAVGVAPVFQHEDREVSTLNNNIYTPSSSNAHGFGYELGLIYNVPFLFLNHLDVAFGAVYKSELDISSDIDITNAEYGFGLSFNYHASTVTFDYRNVDLKRNDTKVYAIGYEYLANRWAARVGYNHTENPNDIFIELSDYQRSVENHYTVGFGFDIVNSLTLDVAYMFTQDEKKVYEACSTNAVDAKHSQDAFTIGLTSRF